MTNFRRVVLGLAILAGTVATAAATADESRTTLRVTVDDTGADAAIAIVFDDSMRMP